MRDSPPYCSILFSVLLTESYTVALQSTAKLVRFRLKGVRVGERRIQAVSSILLTLRRGPREHFRVSREPLAVSLRDQSYKIHWSPELKFQLR